MARSAFTLDEAISQLRAAGSQENRAGMGRFGIETDKAFGVSMPDIRAIAKEIEPDHALAETLWQSGFHEARILASLVDRPKWVTPEQMDRWTKDFNSWDVCDQVCGNLWDRTPYCDEKIYLWAGDEREFVRRAAFATIAWRAVHDKKADDAAFLPYLQLIEAASADERNFVKKAANWALRRIGKRSAFLHPHALKLSQELAERDHATARWIGKDAAKELESAKLRERLAL